MILRNRLLRKGIPLHAEIYPKELRCSLGLYFQVISSTNWNLSNSYTLLHTEFCQLTVLLVVFSQIAGNRIFILFLYHFMSRYKWFISYFLPSYHLFILILGKDLFPTCFCIRMLFQDCRHGLLCLYPFTSSYVRVESQTIIRNRCYYIHCFGCQGLACHIIQPR